MPSPLFVPLLGSGSRTAAGNGDTIDLTQYANGLTSKPPSLRVQCEVTAVSGTTPTMTMLIEDSVDGVNWNTIGTFAAQTAISRLVIQIAPSGVAQAAGFAWPFNYKRVRCRWTMGGATSNFTVNVKAAFL